MGGEVNAYSYSGQSAIRFVDIFGRDYQLSVGVSGTAALGGGFSGGTSIGISTDGTVSGTRFILVVQANGLLGPGGFIGVSGVVTSANVGLLASFGIAGDFTDEGFGGSLAVKRGIGLGIIPAFGPSTITTITTPSLGELFGTIPGGFEDLVEVITDC